MTLDQSKRSLIIYGPRGCGKTTNAQALREAYGLKTVVDVDYLPAEGAMWPTDHLYLVPEHGKTEALRRGYAKDRILAFEDAMRIAGLESKHVKLGKNLGAILQEKSQTTEAILAERGSRYGSFRDNSRISQELKDLFDRENQARILRKQLPLQYHQKEALDMIAAKICHILSGDPEYADNWDDIAGYAQLGKNPR